MTGFGEYLRSHREAAGVDLETMSETTRISVRMLQSLEIERFEELPGGVFNFSFVRQYARCIGLDEEEAVEHYRAIGPSSTPLPFSELESENKDPFLAQTAAARVAEALSRFLRERLGALASVSIGLLLVLGGLYSYQTWEPTAIETASGGSAPMATSPQAETLRTATATPKPAPRRPTMPIELEVEITDTVWIRASADGSRVFEGTYRAGQRKPISARDSVTLNVGNAGGVRLALNGNELPALGPRGHVRRVRVTADGVEVLYASPKPKPKPESSDVESTRAEAAAGAVAWSGRR